MIYLSDLLPAKYPEDFKNLLIALENHNIPYHLLSGTKDIWLRDFMPVRTRSGKLVCFRYEPIYLVGFENVRTDFQNDIASQLGLPVEYSDINLDGGNVVFSPSRSKVIISERIFSENKNDKKEALAETLTELLEAEVVFIPAIPPKEDMTGHADGMVRFVAEDQVIVNDVDRDDPALKTALDRHGIEIVDCLPYFDSHKSDSAIGCYLNYLEIGDLILLPVFGIEMDGEVVEKARAVFQGKTVVPVLIPDIAKEGGCLNCISWEI